MYDLNNLYLSMMTNETHKDDQDDDAVLAKEDVADETWVGCPMKEERHKVSKT